MESSERTLINDGGIRHYCTEPSKVKCSECGDTTHSPEDWDANNNVCLICEVGTPNHVCTRCDSDLGAPPLGEHPCYSLSLYRKTRQVVFAVEMIAEREKEQQQRNHLESLERSLDTEKAERERLQAEVARIALEAKMAADVLESECTRQVSEAERRAFAAESKAETVKKDKDREVDSANARARDAESRFEAIKREKVRDVEAANARTVDAQRRSSEELGRLAEALADAERRVLEERERATRASIEAGKTEDAVRGRIWTTASIILSAVAAAYGAWVVWLMPAFVLPRTVDNAIGFALATVLAWFLCVVPLFVAHSSLRFFAPVVWAAVCIGWPPLTASIACHVYMWISISVVPGGIFFASFAICGVALACAWTGGAALSMRAPWPSALVRSFKGLRSLWVWAGLLVTMSLDAALILGALGYQWEQISTLMLRQVAAYFR
jgi:hypothetical protein